MDIKTIKRFIRNIIFFIALIVLTFWILFKDQDMNKLFNTIKIVKTPWVVLGFFVMLLFFYMEAYNIKSILNSFGEKISIFKAYKFSLIGFFFSAITPAATGGQPMEIYYMNKEKISSAHATMALLMQLCGFQISTLSLGIICAILNPSILKGGLLFLFLGSQPRAAGHYERGDYSLGAKNAVSAIGIPVAVISVICSWLFLRFGLR